MNAPPPPAPWRAALAAGLPTLETARLRLRAFSPADAPSLQRLAGDEAIARTTLSIPHPYEDGVAEAWILEQRRQREAGAQACFAVVRRDDGALAGVVVLALDGDHARAELGYWIGTPYWGRGYATEAGRAALGYAFGALGLRRVHAAHMADNAASGRVLAKLGMRREGVLRQHIHKGGRFHDSVQYGLLREEFDAA